MLKVVSTWHSLRKIQSVNRSLRNSSFGIKMIENSRKKFTHVTSLDDVFSESSKKHSIEKATHLVLAFSSCDGIDDSMGFLRGLNNLFAYPDICIPKELSTFCQRISRLKMLIVAYSNKMSFESTSATFTLKNKQLSLPALLFSIFKNDKAKVIDVQQLDGESNFLLHFECYSDDMLSQISEKFSQHPDVENFSLTSDIPRARILSARTMWFPHTIADLDICAKNVLMYGSELDADHPGFKDEAYRKRRKFFTNIALNYKHGDPIPHVDYTKEEIKTWGEVYNRLTELYPTYACKQFLQNLPLLSLYCNYSEDTVPQLETVSQFLQEKTGFRIRPVAGFLSPRDFLAGLAFRVFNCTQYIRHSSDPLYTPEPDVCHELLGHVPLLADLEFAQYSQEIGLASLGASDDDISKLAACYLYTVEFGLCKEKGQLKAYGAGLLSSISELKHALTTPEKVIKFDPVRASTQEFYVTTFQPVYFVSESFEEAQKDMRNFVKNIKRPFSVRYDPLTNSIHVIDSLSSLQSTVRSLSRDVNLISNALQQILTK